MTYAYKKLLRGKIYVKGMMSMSSCKFAGGKCKGGSETSAYLRHNDGTKENRARVKEAKERKGEYCNIDVDRSHLNYNIDVETGKAVDSVPYEQMWKKYKDREVVVENLPTNTNKRKDRVTCIFVEIPFPMSLTGDANREKGKRWAEKVTEIFIKKYGKDNICSVCVHADEVHEYLDVRDNYFRESRYHIHLGIVAEHDGSWNGKWISKQSHMTALNRQVEAMTQSEFGCPFLTGEKYKSRRSIQDLKAESAVLEAKEDIVNREKVYREMLQRQSDLKKDIEVLEDTKKKSLAELQSLRKEKSDIEDEIERIRVANDDADARFEMASQKVAEAAETYDTVKKDAEELISDISQIFATAQERFEQIRDRDLSRKAWMEGRQVKIDGEVISEEEFYQRRSSFRKSEQDKAVEEEKAKAIEAANRLLEEYRKKHADRVRQAEKIVIAPPDYTQEDEDDNPDIILPMSKLRRLM